MTTSVGPNQASIAQELATSLKGKLDQPKIDSIIASLGAPSQAYRATSTFISIIFYFKVVTRILDDSTSFDGNAGGIGLPTGGSGVGDLRTDDKDRLYRDTVSFSFVSTMGYLGIQYFDANHNLLGHYDGASIGIAATGGGTGHWA